MGDVKRYDDITLSLDYLCSGGILINDAKTLFMKHPKGILVFNADSRYYLKEDEFKELFKEVSFWEYNNDDLKIDTLKDEEYYGFKHK